MEFYMNKGFTSLMFFTLILSLLILGCKKDDELVQTVTPITVDLFPLTVGHQITFSGFLRDAATDTNIIATGAVYKTTWTIESNSAPLTSIGMSGTATYIIDSTTVPAGAGTFTKVSPVFVQRANATGTDNFSFITSVGKFFRTFGIVRPDSLKWILIADLTVGETGSWTAFDSTYTYGGTHTVRLEIVGKWEGKENLTLNGTSFETYKLATRRNIYLDGSATPAPGSGALTASIWLAADIGPVKMILNADGESMGNYREYMSKSW